MWLVTSSGCRICVGAGDHILGKGVRGITLRNSVFTLGGGAGGDTTLGDGVGIGFCTGFYFMLKVCCLGDTTLGGGVGISTGGSGGMIGKCVVAMGVVCFCTGFCFTLKVCISSDD